MFKAVDVVAVTHADSVDDHASVVDVAATDATDVTVGVEVPEDADVAAVSVQSTLQAKQESGKTINFLRLKFSFLLLLFEDFFVSPHWCGEFWPKRNLPRKVY